MGLANTWLNIFAFRKTEVLQSIALVSRNAITRCQVFRHTQLIMVEVENKEDRDCQERDHEGNGVEALFQDQESNESQLCYNHAA